MVEDMYTAVGSDLTMGREGLLLLLSQVVGLVTAHEDGLLD